jgi:general secretion pathway protein A
MYLAHFQLQDEPFRLTPDPRYLHFSEPHHAVLKTFLEGILYHRGLILISGPIGTGKTMLVHTALQILTELSRPERPMRTALLFNPTLTREEFFEAVLGEFEISSASSSKPSRLAALHQMLLNTQQRGGRAALIIDEAHLLSSELLEEVRLLGNADTHQEKLLQIVLCGQPELITMLNRPELSALQQRVACRAQLRPLSEAETRAYISERLHTAGLTGPSPFPNHTVDALHRFSQGVPRLINLMCENCLVFGFETDRKIVQPDMVEEVAASLNLAPPVTSSERAAPRVDAGRLPRASQPSTVDLLIEAMKQGRTAVREQN